MPPKSVQWGESVGPARDGKAALAYLTKSQRDRSIDHALRFAVRVQHDMVGVGRGLATRIAAACALAFFATSAVADDDDVQYSYTFQTIKRLHFCDFNTMIVHVPMMIKLTAAVIGDDTKPADHNVRVMYMVEAFVAVPGKQTQFDLKEVKVLSGRIISNVFNTDLMASKNDDNRPSLGASYSITTEGSLALFYNLMAQNGTYTLSVELENQPILGLDVKPTPKMDDPVMKWLKCSIAVSRNKLPQ